jgi:hypothetical protein
MTPQIRRFAFASLAVVAVGAVAYQICWKALPRLSAGLIERISEAAPASPLSRPTPEIERLRGKHAGAQRVTATMRLSNNGDARPLRGNEIATLLKIIRQLTVFEKPKGVVCVLLPPFFDEVTISTEDSTLPIQIEVSSNRALMRDRLSFQTYVVPEQQIATLTALMAAANPDSKPDR